jgi:hypothetical protein
MAFDLSDHWLNRWCQFCEAEAVSTALKEIDELCAILAKCDPDTVVSIEHFFAPSLVSLTDQLEKIRRIFVLFLQNSHANLEIG